MGEDGTYIDRPVTPSVRSGAAVVQVVGLARISQAHRHFSPTSAWPVMQGVTRMIRTHLVRRSSAVRRSVLVVQAGGIPYFSNAAWAASDDPRVAVLPVSSGDAVPAKAATRFRDLLSDELKGRYGIAVIDPP